MVLEFCDVCACYHDKGATWCQDIGEELLAAVKAPLNPRFTLTEVMDAVKEAFALVGGETARDCVVEQTVRETLSARPVLGKDNEMKRGEKIARRRKNVEQP